MSQAGSVRVLPCGCMKQYEARSYSIPAIAGISEKTLEVHFGLYKGYVTNLNAHYAALEKLGPDDMLVRSALTRRITFELAGVQNHERYFEALEGGPGACGDSAFSALVTEQYGSFEGYIKHFRNTALMMRGVGWVLTLYDTSVGALHTIWTVDHELGNVSLPIVLAIDMWEHAYMLDHLPSEKGAYVDAYLNAVNWGTVERRFDLLHRG